MEAVAALKGPDEASSEGGLRVHGLSQPIAEDCGCDRDRREDNHYRVDCGVTVGVWTTGFVHQLDWSLHRWPTAGIEMAADHPWALRDPGAVSLDEAARVGVGGH